MPSGVAVLWVVAVRCAGASPPAHDGAAGVRDADLAAVVAASWQERLRRDPVEATRLGDARWADQWPDDGAVARAESARVRRELLARAVEIAEPSLDEGDRLTRALLVDRLQSEVATELCRVESWAVGPRFNAWGALAGLAEAHPLTDDAMAKAYERRVAAWPALVDTAVENLRAGSRDGLAPAAGNLRNTVALLDAALAEDPARWPFVAPVDGGAGTERTAATGVSVRRLARRVVRPALQRYRDVLAEELLPTARDGALEGLGAMPQGAPCYRALIRQHTTLDRGADELHALGLAEIERLHAAFRATGQRVFGTDDLHAIFDRLRVDPALRFADVDSVVAEAERTLRAAEAAVPAWFHRSPATPCTVEPMPTWEAEWSTIAYYRPAIPGARDAHGTYVVNTWRPETRPRHEAPALSFHEAVPGHHFQVAFTQELGELPAFRRYDGITAFVEGWALYAEALADEMGLYRDDTERLGMYAFDAWRAARLVVDTGIHAKGWTREQAVRWMVENTPLAENNIVNEVDRYVSWPGQALGYKVGQIEILALRRQAEEQLGDRFDVRAFHDVVLGAGAVTLPLLRARVEAWIASVDKAAGPL